MQGFWTVKFNGVQGWGAGTITMVAGKVFGGDSSYLYTGTYNQNGDHLSARVHVKQFNGALSNVMGRAEFDLELSGTKANPNIINATGKIPGTQLQLGATLAKQSDI